MKNVELGAGGRGSLRKKQRKKTRLSAWCCSKYGKGVVFFREKITQNKSYFDRSHTSSFDNFF